MRTWKNTALEQINHLAELKLKYRRPQRSWSASIAMRRTSSLAEAPTHWRCLAAMTLVRPVCRALCICASARSVQLAFCSISALGPAHRSGCGAGR